jgi:hypothetical protein
MPAAPFHAKIEEMPRDGGKNAVGAGELLYIPAGMPFLGRVIGDEVVLNLDVFAPAREELPVSRGTPDRKGSTGS